MSKGEEIRGRLRRRRLIVGAMTVVLPVCAATACALNVHLDVDRAAANRVVTPPEETTRDVVSNHLHTVDTSTIPLLLDEDFDGTTLDTTVWNTCHWWDDGGCTIASNDELEWYLPGQVQVGDGTLRLTAEKRQVTGADGKLFPYTSGMVSTGPPVHDGQAKLAFTYGTVEVGFRAPLGAGLWPAIWMLPASEESTPEIDIFEAVGQLPHQANMYLHPARDSGADRYDHRVTLPAGRDLADDHTVRLDWNPGRLDFYFDEVKVWEVTGEQVPDEPMYLVMNLAVGGVYGGPPDPAAFPATFSIDRVRIWSGDRS